MNTRRLFLFLSVLPAILFSVPSVTYAIPAFARTHEVPCSLCHTGFPKLNHFGMEFLQRGYRMPEKDGQFLWEQPLPLSGRIDLSYLSVKDEWDPETPFSLGGFPPFINTSSSSFGLTDWQLMAGGTVAPKLSFMFQLVGIAERLGPDITDDIVILEPSSKTASHSGGLIPLPGAPVLQGDTLKTDILTEQLFVQINDLLPEAQLNIRAGRYHADNHLLSEPHRLTFTNYLVQIQSVLGPTLTSTTEGVELNGFFSMGFRYAVGLRNYGPQYDSPEDREQRVGAYYAIISQMLRSGAVSLMVSGDRVGDANLDKDDQTLAVGAAASLQVGKLIIVPGVFRYAEGENIRTGRELIVTSGTLELTYAVLSNLLATARYDKLFWNLDRDSSDRQADQYVINLSWYPYPLVRFALEYSRFEAENLVLVSLPEGPMFLPAFADVRYTQNMIAFLLELAF
jgi:hypothetical protein